MTQSESDEKAGLNHPCKETCSGWQQGYEAGIAYRDKNPSEYVKALERVTLKAKELLESYTDGFGGKISPEFYSIEDLNLNEALSELEKLKGGRFGD